MALYLPGIPYQKNNPLPQQGAVVPIYQDLLDSKPFVGAFRAVEYGEEAGVYYWDHIGVQWIQLPATGGITPPHTYRATPQTYTTTSSDYQAKFGQPYVGTFPANSATSSAGTSQLSQLDANAKALLAATQLALAAIIRQVFQAVTQTYTTTQADYLNVCGSGTQTTPITRTSSQGTSSLSQADADSKALADATSQALGGIVCAGVALKVAELKVHGNSLDKGYDGTAGVDDPQYSWLTYAQSDFFTGNPDYAITGNYSHSGWSSGQILADMQANAATYFTKDPAYARHVFYIGDPINGLMFGTESVSDAVNNIRACHALAQSYGWITLGVDCTANYKEYGIGVAAGNTLREDYNDNMRGLWRDDWHAKGFVDLGSDPNIGAFLGAGQANSYFQTDGQHMSLIGAPYKWQLIKPAFQAVAVGNTYGTVTPIPHQRGDREWYADQGASGSGSSFTWTDASGSGDVLSPESGASAVLVANGGPNNQPYVEMTGGRLFGSLNLGAAGNSARCGFIVAQLPDGGNKNILGRGYDLLDGTAGGSALDGKIQDLVQFGGKLIVHALGNNNVGDGPPITNPTAWALYQFEIDNNSLVLTYVNNTSIGAAQQFRQVDTVDSVLVVNGGMYKQLNTPTRLRVAALVLKPSLNPEASVKSALQTKYAL